MVDVRTWLLSLTRRDATHQRKARKACLLLAAILAIPGARADAGDEEPPPPTPKVEEPTNLPAIGPPQATTETPEKQPPGVMWGSLFKDSLRFVAAEHSFRYMTEEGTRHPHRPFFQGYLDSVGGLHGWADGDEFYVNYVGHPMQGAVSGYIWTLNDPRYYNVQFGRNREYWRSRLRAAAFAWAYSIQMEIGPFSEASIGNIQATYPQWGFVDHVVTPAIGMGWMIGEDVVDRYLLGYLERKVKNPYARALIRGTANPSRSFANLMAFHLPWYRTRDLSSDYMTRRPKPEKAEDSIRPNGVPPFEFAANGYGFAGPGGNCAGGGSTAAFRIASQWQAVVDVNGCKMLGHEKNLSGDGLTYMAGPRWTPRVTGRLVPYVQVLAGGNKVTQELMIPEKAEPRGVVTPQHKDFTKQFELDGFAMAAGMGLDVHVNHALAMRLIGVDYVRSWTNALSGFAVPNGFQVKFGVVLKMGTW